MQITLAKSAGFCSGVRRAIDIIEETLEARKNKNLPKFSLGQVIHNPEVVKRLSEKGLKVISYPIRVTPPAVIILPTHGIPLNLIKLFRKKGFTLVDVTCPYVAYVQNICAKLNNEGYQVMIVGDKDHPEIKALLAITPKALVIDKNFSLRDNYKNIQYWAIISQTTQSEGDYFYCISNILNKIHSFKEIKIFNTICKDVKKRQREIINSINKVNIILVVGGKNSANTKRMVKLSRSFGVTTYHIEDPKTVSNLRRSRLLNAKIGIFSGASTPDWQIKEVIMRLKNLMKEVK